MLTAAQHPAQISPPTGPFPVFDIARIPDSAGTLLSSHAIPGVEAPLAAIRIGERGRGAWESVLIVAGASPGDVLHYASVVASRSGTCKLLAMVPAPGPTSHCILVARLEIGFRGSNSFTGDRYSADCDVHPPTPYVPFPGITLAEGEISQGAAGRMGSGLQRILLLPRGAVLRLAMYGRHAPDPLYYCFDGDAILARSWEQRMAALDVPGDTFPAPPPPVAP